MNHLTRLHLPAGSRFLDEITRHRLTPSPDPAIDSVALQLLLGSKGSRKSEGYGPSQKLACPRKVRFAQICKQTNTLFRRIFYFFFAESFGQLTIAPLILEVIHDSSTPRHAARSSSASWSSHLTSVTSRKLGVQVASDEPGSDSPNGTAAGVSSPAIPLLSAVRRVETPIGRLLRWLSFWRFAVALISLISIGGGLFLLLKPEESPGEPIRIRKHPGICMQKITLGTDVASCS